MTTTRIIALCACVTLMAAIPARVAAQVPQTMPKLPDEYKMQREKEAEARKSEEAKKAEGENKTDAAKPADAAKSAEAAKKDTEKKDPEKKDTAKKAEAERKDSAASGLEATRKAEAAKRAEAADAAKVASAERAEARKKAEAERKAVVEQRRADQRAAVAKKAEERKAAQAAKADADKQKAADKKAADDAKKAAEVERRAGRQQEILERAKARKAAEEEKDAADKGSAEQAAAEKAAVEKAAAADRAAAAERAQKAAGAKAATQKVVTQPAAATPAAPSATAAPQPMVTQPAAASRPAPATTVAQPPATSGSGAPSPVAAQPAASSSSSQPPAGSGADKKAVDERMPPAVIRPGQQPDAWKMQQEKDRERAREGGSQASTGKPGASEAQKRAAATKPKQPWRGWSDRAIVSLNGGWQSSSFELTDTADFAPPIQGDRERRTMSADYAVEPGVSLDLSGVVRAWKGLGVGVAVTRFRDARDVPVSGTVPHPFFFNQGRSVDGTVAGVRQEMAVHLDAVWVVPASRKLQIALFAGPTFYSVKQTVVRDFTFSEQYPYDSATLTGLTADDESSSVTGFNAGADVGYYFTEMIGVGGLVRLGRGKVDSSLGSLDVGGPEFGFGLRLRIPKSRNTARPATPQPPKTTPQPAPRPR